MAFSIFRQIFGGLQQLSEEEKRKRGNALVRIMFIVAIVGIIASLLIPFLWY